MKNDWKTLDKTNSLMTVTIITSVVVVKIIGKRLYFGRCHLFNYADKSIILFFQTYL